MKLYCVAVKDLAANTFSPPMFVAHPMVAQRGFSTQVNRDDGGNNPLFTNPEHFELWQLATWDDESGKFTELPDRICRGEEVKRQLN